MKVYKQSIVDKGHLGALSNLSVLALTKSCEIGRVCSPLTGWTNVMKVLSIFPFSIQQFAWKSWLHGSDISRNVTPNILHILEKHIWKYTAIFWGLTVLWEKARFHFSKKRRGHRSVRLWLFFFFHYHRWHKCHFLSVMLLLRQHYRPVQVALSLIGVCVAFQVNVLSAGKLVCSPSDLPNLMLPCYFGNTACLSDGLISVTAHK